MSHSSHYQCANHHRLALRGTVPLECCECVKKEGCGDSQSDEWINKVIAEGRKEREIKRNILRVEDNKDDLDSTGHFRKYT